MPAEPIRKLVILGGGTAGWMAAAMASRTWGQRLSITLVESEAIGTVGVGEATIPPLIKLLRFLGLDEDVTLRNIQGTFKFGIEFDGWRRKGESYMHSFGTPGAPIGIVPFYQYWLRRHLAGEDCGSLWDYSLNTQVSHAGKMSREPRIEGNLPGPERAFHFDAGLLAQFMRRGCEASGVVRREGKVSGVNLRPEDGFIESLTLDSGEIIDGDMFIDCSGFVGVLIEGALKAGYEDWTHWLPCDRAVAVPCKSSGTVLPYTRSTAHAAGWQWRIPLQHRTGNGHVYASQFISDDEAARVMMENLDGESLADPRPLAFVTGRRRQFWNRNVIAIGLSSGFMEPLESTSLYLIQSGIAKLLTLFPDKDFDPVLRNEFNRQTLTEFERIRDFIILHYKLTQRDDSPLWRYCAHMDVPDSLQESLELFGRYGKIPSKELDLFGMHSWLAVHIGQLHFPKRNDPLAAYRTTDGVAWLNRFRGLIENAAGGLPSHMGYIKQAGMSA